MPYRRTAVVRVCPPHQRWLRAGAIPPLSAAAIHLWAFSLRAAAARLTEYGSWLGLEEVERAGSFVFSRDCDRYVVAHARLRQLLGAYLGVSPAALAFRHGPHGKPCLSGPEVGLLQFNLTHDREVALVAVALRLEVGVDVETLRIIPEADALARHLLTDAGRPVQLPPREPERSTLFLRHWTRKEALAKARGVGVAHSAGQSGPGIWSARTIESPVAGYIVSVAASGRRWAVEQCLWLDQLPQSPAAATIAGVSNIVGRSLVTRGDGNG